MTDVAARSVDRRQLCTTSTPTTFNPPDQSLTTSSTDKMASHNRRPKAKHPAHYPVHAPSNPHALGGLPSDEELPPPPQTRTNSTLNLSVLRRLYPEITSILSVAPFAVLYHFSPDSASWEKSGVEGTLFIVSLTPTPLEPERYATLLLNRKGLSNSLVRLTGPEDVEVTSEYVILKSGETVEALWIFSEPAPASTARDREVNAAIIVECVASADRARKRVEENVMPVEVKGSVEMGRHLSLRDLFGKTVPQERLPESQHQQAQMFAPSADTDFFRTPGGNRGYDGLNEEPQGVDHLTEMLRLSVSRR
ncbi:MAG: hypothetical protein M1814_006213 [Vezdaea aestivalis]|nr:MAG: hypothetical protein M1814_006213 [Vezdaea aestivalis]